MIRLEYDHDMGFIVPTKVDNEWEIQNLWPEMLQGWKCPWREAVDKARELAREMGCGIAAFTKSGKRRTVAL